MTFVNGSTLSAPRHYAPACIALLLSGFISVLHINLPGGSVSLLLLPLLIVSLWPRGVNNVVSIATVFCVGLLMDWGTNGALGQWALVYLAVFALLRPDRRERRVSFVGAIGLWVTGLIAGVIVLIITGGIVYGVLPNFGGLFRQALLVTLFLPLVIGIRTATRFILTDPHDRDYL